MDKKRNRQNTFIIKVTDCQNDSWQGQIVWADENKSKRFRSALEMMRLMDEAISEGQSMNEIGKDHFAS